MVYMTPSADRNPLLWWPPLLQLVPVCAMACNRAWYAALPLLPSDVALWVWQADQQARLSKPKCAAEMWVAHWCVDNTCI